MPKDKNKLFETNYSIHKVTMDADDYITITLKKDKNLKPFDIGQNTFLLFTTEEGYAIRKVKDQVALKINMAVFSTVGKNVIKSRDQIGAMDKVLKSTKYRTILKGIKKDADMIKKIDGMTVAEYLSNKFKPEELDAIETTTKK